jgi:hypothetical protein
LLLRVRAFVESCQLAAQLDGSYSSASDSGLRPECTSSGICLRKSGGYGGRLFGIVDSSPKW